MDYYWLTDSDGNLVRVPEDKVKSWDPKARVELSEEQKERTWRFITDTIEKLKRQGIIKE